MQPKLKRGIKGLIKGIIIAAIVSFVVFLIMSVTSYFSTGSFELRGDYEIAFYAGVFYFVIISAIVGFLVGMFRNKNITPQN
jgi:uncharacterized membrane protein YozB (DUF420 family)